jgi:hypothetical protein
LTSPKQINSQKITSPKLTSPKLNSPKITSPKITSPKLPLNGKVKTEDEEEEDDLEDQRSPGSPSKNGPNSCPKGAGSGSPTKLGLPDNSGLIVGVNTINYDASSSVRNKAKSREERKMEMIMKAIEAMEKAEQRKKDTTGSESGQTPTGTGNAGGKRRRSSSSYRNSVNAFDSNVEASSADESKPEPKRNRKRGRSNSKQSNAGTPQRRRSRVLSGGSVSNMSNDELAANNQIQSSEIPSNNTPGTGQTGSGNNAMSSVPFRFPKTKKSLMSDWLQESESNSVVDDDDVSANYLKGSRSPPGIATHLLRTASSPVKNVCSAKKRWLRQAISEDHTDADVAYVNGGSYSEEINMPSPSSEAAMDTVTPLKKRRLANYKKILKMKKNSWRTWELEIHPLKMPRGMLNMFQMVLKSKSCKILCSRLFSIRLWRICLQHLLHYLNLLTRKPKLEMNQRMRLQNTKSLWKPKRMM